MSKNNEEQDYKKYFKSFWDKIESIIVFAILCVSAIVYYYGFDFLPDKPMPNERWDWYNTDPLGFIMVIVLFIIYIVWKTQKK